MNEFSKIVLFVSVVSVAFALVFVSVQWAQTSDELTRVRSHTALRDRATRVVAARQIVQAQELRAQRALLVEVARSELTRQKTLGALVGVAQRQNNATVMLARRTGLMP